MIEKAEKLANMTYSIIAKSCNKVIIGKAYWKGVVLPAILYGAAILDMNENEIRKLQRIENGVARRILGAPRYAAVGTLRGEIGMSEMKTRIIGGRIQYMKSIEERGNELLKRMLEEMKEDANDRWMKVTRKYLDEIGINERVCTRMGKEEIKRKCREMDNRKWKEELEGKSSLGIYRRWKKEIKEEKVYDNRPASITLYKARTNCLPLNERKRHQEESTICEICGEGVEDIKHFMLYCREWNEERRKIIDLQQPYEEREEDIIGRFLFAEERLEEKKEFLHNIWKKRELKLKELKGDN